MGKKISRRHFIGSALGSAAYLAAFSSPFSLMRRVRAATSQKRYLINIQAMGGWDTHWFHHAIPASHANFKANGVDYNLNSATQTQNYFHQRFPDAHLLQHPNRSDVYMGKGMNYLFGDSVGMDLLKNDIAIWRGMQISAAHTIGNQIILGGSTSSYALSFSALIAQGIASTDYQRILHYVQQTPNPTSFNSTFAMNTGAAVPVNLPDFPSLQSLTAPNSSDFTSATPLGIVNNGVNQLSKISENRFSMSTTQQVYSTFLNGFNGATQLSQTNLATSNRFYYLWRTYTDAMLNAVNGMYNSPANSIGDFLYRSSVDNTGKAYNTGVVYPLGVNETTPYPPFTWDYGGVFQPIAGLDISQNSLPNTATQGGEGISAQTDVANALTSLGGASCPFSSYTDAAAADTAGTLASSNAWINAFINNAPNFTGYAATIYGTAFSYALAEIMIREDLAAVMDIPTPTNDAHDGSNAHLILLMITFSAYKTLLSNLKNGPGGNLLAQTTVAMWTELDRDPKLDVDIAGNWNRGTGHNQTTSILLAGYGVNGGTVVGDVMTGPGGAYDSSWQFNQNSGWSNNYGGVNGIPWSTAMPVNLANGLTLPSNQVAAALANGSAAIPTSQCVLPTMLAIFGFEVPQNQITDGFALNCLLKNVA